MRETPTSRNSQPAPRADTDKYCYQHRTMIEPRYNSQSNMPFKDSRENGMRQMDSQAHVEPYSMINDSAPTAMEKGIPTKQSVLGGYDNRK